jgi:hypothetical protein
VSAKFCPKCGKPALAAAPDPTRPRMAAGAVPSTAPIPRIGKLFLGSVIVGLGLLVGGALTPSVALLYAGLAVLGGVTLVSLIGHHVT